MGHDTRCYVGQKLSTAHHPSNTIPTTDAVPVVRECLEKDNALKEHTSLHVDQIVDLVFICLNSTDFTNKKTPKTPISPIVANLYMEKFESVVLENYSCSKHKLWLRYVDDTFVVRKKCEQQ